MIDRLLFWGTTLRMEIEKMACWPDVKITRQPCGLKMCPRIRDLKQKLAEEQAKNNIPTWGWF